MLSFEQIHNIRNSEGNAIEENSDYTLFYYDSSNLTRRILGSQLLAANMIETVAKLKVSGQT